MTTLADITIELKNRGYTPKVSSDAIELFLCPDTGHTRYYQIYEKNRSTDWGILFIETILDDFGEETEEEAELGEFKTAEEVVDAIDNWENGGSDEWNESEDFVDP